MTISLNRGSRPGRWIAPAGFAWLTLASCSVAWSAPFIPATDDEVLERLPPRQGTLWLSIPALRATLAAEPLDLSAGTELARTYLRLYRQNGDARLLGYAEAALGPWWDQSDPPLPAAMLRAELHQTLHEFDRATAELHAILRREPQQGEAWLQLASIAQVRGDHGTARGACARLALTTDPEIAGACLAASNAAMGRGRQALAFMEHALVKEPSSVTPWMRTIAGEIAVGLGQTDDAERHFVAGLKAARVDGGQPDLYLLNSYADLLLDAGRDREVLALLADHSTADNALLRIARAELRLKLPAGPRHRDELAARFAALVARGDLSHGREQAYLALYVQDDPRSAVTVAARNWQMQREVIDSRLYLEAAARAGDATATAAVRKWLAALGTADVRLAGPV